MCTGELSFYWLIQHGFKKFKAVGIDNNCSSHRRHNLFMMNGDCTDVEKGHLFDGWEDFMFNRKMKVVSKYKVEWERI